jgi:hypothetical protein
MEELSIDVVLRNFRLSTQQRKISKQDLLDYIKSKINDIPIPSVTISHAKQKINENKGDELSDSAIIELVKFCKTGGEEWQKQKL